MAARIINAAGGVHPINCILEFDIARAASETDAGYSFKDGDIIKRVWIDVATAEVTGTTTMDIGLNGTGGDDDADGLANDLSTAAANVVIPKCTVTTGSNTKYMASTTTGALLADFQAGTDVDQDEGVYVEKFHVVTSTTPLTYTLGSAQTELVAKGYVEFIRLPRSLP
jgi:hypothetical protein